VLPLVVRGVTVLIHAPGIAWPSSSENLSKVGS
jgi:hypothetical protein